MREIMRTNDPVVLSLAQSLLKEAEIPLLIADTSMSVMEGSIGVLPQRLLVADDCWTEARQILADAGLGIWLLDQ